MEKLAEINVGVERAMEEVQMLRRIVYLLIKERGGAVTFNGVDMLQVPTAAALEMETLRDPWMIVVRTAQ